MPKVVVTTYVDEAVAQLRRLKLLGKWKPTPSDVTDADLNGLEAELGTAFPPLYRDLLKYVHFRELTFRGLSFEPHVSAEWHKRLQDLYFKSWIPERVVGKGLVPFGAETLMDAGPVCFDTRRRLPDGDCPVVFWDHESVSTDREIGALFSSSAKMFECLTFVARNDLDFIYHDESDETAVLPRKRELLKAYLAMDPAGAGGPARAYWTAWGVLGNRAITEGPLASTDVEVAHRCTRPGGFPRASGRQRGRRRGGGSAHVFCSGTVERSVVLPALHAAADSVPSASVEPTFLPERPRDPRQGRR